MLIFILALIGMILLWLLYRYLPNKRAFWGFCLILILAGTAFYTAFPSWHEEPAMSVAERQKLLEQQKIFIDWYDNYKKYIDQMDYNWQWYHQILASFAADNISIETTYLRLVDLEAEEQKMAADIAELAPPIELNDYCYDLLIVVLKKTSDYAAAQYQTVALTRAAADPLSIATDDQQEQSRLLREIMEREAPNGLFTASEIYTIRNMLSVPDESPTLKTIPDNQAMGMK